MELYRRLIESDIPFARDDAHRMLPAMVACLIGFAALLLALAVSLSGNASDKAREVTGVLQVEIPVNVADQSESLNRVVAAVRSTPGVESLSVLRDKDMEALLKPWLGEDFNLSDLPVPSMIDVKTGVKNGKTVVDVTKLGRTLHAIDQGIAVQDRGPWAGQMVKATTLLQSLIVFVAGLLMACVAGMVVLVARTNLKLHFKAVSLLHMFGATDEYILRQFQWNNAALAGRGALGGVLVSALVFIAWVVLSHRWKSPVLPPMELGLGHGLTFLLLPLLTGLIAFIATRLTVQSMLRHMH